MSPTFGRVGFVAVSKPMAGVGMFAEVLYTCISCGRRSTHAYHRGRRSARDSSSPLDMRGGQGGYFFERGCILEPQILRFPKLICVTGAAGAVL